MSPAFISVILKRPWEVIGIKLICILKDEQICWVAISRLGRIVEYLRLYNKLCGPLLVISLQTYCCFRENWSTSILNYVPNPCQCVFNKETLVCYRVFKFLYTTDPSKMDISFAMHTLQFAEVQFCNYNFCASVKLSSAQVSSCCIMDTAMCDIQFWRISGKNNVLVQIGSTQVFFIVLWCCYIMRSIF